MLILCLLTDLQILLQTDPVDACHDLIIRKYGDTTAGIFFVYPLFDRLLPAFGNSSVPACLPLTL